MLLIIELLFFVAGLWAIISGKIPSGLFKFLFGKGEYELPSNKARLLTPPKKALRDQKFNFSSR